MARPGLEGGSYSPLSDDQVEEIHQASLEVLETTGLGVEHVRARELFEQGGARVLGDRVFIGRQMVAEALRRHPTRVLLAGRDVAQDVWLEGKRVYMGTGGSPTTVLDVGADTVRPAGIRDLADLVRLADALEHCDFVVIPMHPTDLPEHLVPINRFFTCLQNTTKHVMGGLGSVEGALQVIEMGIEVAGSLAALQQRPFLSAITSWMVSPLHLDTAVTDILVTWCEHGLPVALSSAPMAGSTSPVTLAGTLVQLNAEQLSGIVLTQLIRPGTPVLAGYIPGVADMRTGRYLGGSAEFGIMQAAAAQMAHHYRVPIYCSGGMTDSKLPDVQAGYEKMATLLLAAMAGGNYIHHAFGMITNMNTASLEAAVLDNEIAGTVLRVLRGVLVTPDSLALDAIQRVGPAGHYMLDRHTRQHMRSELYYPRISDRADRSLWEAGGRRDLRSVAGDHVRQLLQTHQPVGLPAEVDRSLRARFQLYG